ncbi:MAG: right-handed parallel beta-helix repeat-containing protein [Alphaproteobacteria bacterium]|nr:right-handed parallel beta-helix repeat-containing protein [Alphaproteobacteria bacterium]
MFVIGGDNVTVRNIIFSGASVPDKNGAGIRAEGRNLTVENAQFFDNENGILAAGLADSTIIIRKSRFERNGKCDPVCAHGIYINRVGRLRVENSTFREQHVGHHIKSRARVTEVVGNTIEDGAQGNASYLIDIPNGGQVLIENNRMHKGALATNPTAAISIGAKGATNSPGSIRVVGNRFRSDLPAPTAFVRNSTASPAVLEKNQLAGKVNALEGPGTVAP